MICQQCQQEGKRSTVTAPGCGVTTAMMGHDYYDEAGKYHNHDPNTTSVTYHCSNGHQWISAYKTKCRSCNYNHSKGEQP